MKIRDLRRAKGLTLKQVAEMAQVSEAAMSLYERGKRKPTLLIAFRIAKALGVTVDDLFEKKAG